MMLPENPDPGRIAHVLDEIRAIWEKYPDHALGQLLIAAACAKTALRLEELFYCPDDELVRRLRDYDVEGQRFVEEWKRRGGPPSN
jgi:hypothetical protein